MKTTRILAANLLAGGMLLSSACGSAPTRYTHPNADLGALKRVAVLPFENLTQDRSAGEKVQKIFLSELLSLEAFDVVEPGLVARTLKAERVENVEQLGPADLKRIGEAVKAQGLFMGSVVDFADSRTGSTPSPEVTIQLRLVEAQSGVTIWTASKTRSGASASAKLFGIGGTSLTEAARQLVREELKSLVR